MSQNPILEFGPFRLDPNRRTLIRAGEPLAISDRHLDILHALVARHGQIVGKDALITAAWKDVAVGDNSLEQAISSLRRLLGSTPDGRPYIDTLARRGYRFTSEVTSIAPRATDDALADLLGPYRMFLEGRAAVETLERAGVDRARHVFAEAVEVSPDYAPGHIGLANAAVLAFDATRVDEVPDAAALRTAVHHAREACRLAAESGEAWATLGFVLARSGAEVDAIAAGRRAVAIEPDNWRHHVRLAYASWGEERLRAARHAIRLLPGLALAHWLAATVHVARQAFEDAVGELRVGAAAQDQQQPGGRFGSVGLHLLLGLIHAARGADDAAEEELRQELTFEATGHIFARQAAANAWAALGALRLRQLRTSDAEDAFRRALERVAGHPFALAALSAVANADQRAHRRALHSRLTVMRAHGASVEVAMAQAIVDVLGGRHQDAAARVHDALQAAPGALSAGWTLPVEPLLRASTHADAWAPALTLLRNRAA